MPNSFDVLLLDLNSTFMFGEDRFGPDQPYGETYRGLGGSMLSDGEVQRAVTEVFDTMLAISQQPAYYDSFPSVANCLRTLDSTAAWSEYDLQLVEGVVASHELGWIPASYAHAVHQLATTHRLGVVSNLWSRKNFWIAELERAGLLGTFEWLVFSSDGNSIKPSPRIFKPILDGWTGPLKRVLMIGDSLAADVAGAKATGTSSLWITHGRDPPRGAPRPDFAIPDLRHLPTSGLIS